MVGVPAAAAVAAVAAPPTGRLARRRGRQRRRRRRRRRWRRWRRWGAGRGRPGVRMGPPSPLRLMQMFLYLRYSLDDNHYAQPLDLLPIVEVNAQAVVAIHGADELPPAGAPAQTDMNYRRREVGRNTALPCTWRADPPSPLSVVQPDVPSYAVAGRAVAWQEWTFRVGFNPREGLVLHNLYHGGRRVVDRASLVEMAVPYGDLGGPHPRKCAFDLGDCGLGVCAVSLALGYDCLGAIHYFGATLSHAAGEPVEVPRVVCMHQHVFCCRLDVAIDGARNTVFEVEPAISLHLRRICPSPRLHPIH
ncbi:hypothetical protein I4F81_007461 [Pyropia yezoensis]|uniref:Uncharacterized protein n=1 Tax=Pyropia yezoensis TaxID=2788 RepID=A0ACC3C473_PYRYE|nr:hypothetical protein I4F81_007461 [Neopyropia yezoensis]